MFKKIKLLLFENRDAKQTITKNIIWLSVSQIGSRLIRAVVIIYAARVLGAGEYGIFSYVLGFAGFFTLFADIGVNSLLTRNIANHPNERSRYFASSFGIKTLLIILTIILVVLVAPYFTKIKAVIALLPFVALLVVFDNIREFALAYLRGLEKMEWEALVVTVMNVAIVIAGFIILSFSTTSKALLFSYVASVGFAALLAVILTWQQFLRIFRDFDMELARETLNACWPIAFSGALGVFMLNTDIIMLGWWRTVEEIGYYSAGQRIIQVLYTLPALLASGIFPAISRFIKNGDKERAKSLNEKSITFSFLIATPLAIGGVVLGHPIFELVFGREYLPGALGFQILITTLLLIFPGILLSNLVLAYNQQRKIIWYVAAGSLGNVVFNALLIPSYGIAGSAVATFIAQLLNYGLTWRFLKKIEKFKTFHYLKKIITAAMIMGLSAFVLDKIGVNIILNIILSAGIYFGALYLMKEKILEEGRLLLKNLTG